VARQVTSPLHWCCSGVAIVLFLRGRRAVQDRRALPLGSAPRPVLGYSIASGSIAVRYLIPWPPLLVHLRGAHVSGVVAHAFDRHRRNAHLYVVEFAAIIARSSIVTSTRSRRVERRCCTGSTTPTSMGSGVHSSSAHYLRAHPVGHYRLCYFSTQLDPASYGIEAGRSRSRDLSPPRGTLILSAHCVARAQAGSPATWRRARELACPCPSRRRSSATPTTLRDRALSRQRSLRCAAGPARDAAHHSRRRARETRSQKGPGRGRASRTSVVVEQLGRRRPGTPRRRGASGARPSPSRRNDQEHHEGIVEAEIFTPEATSSAPSAMAWTSHHAG